MNELTVGSILKEAFGRGLKNLPAIAVNAILWILTIWIPYLNVGTTIGMTVGLVMKMKNGEQIKYLEIFDPIYRKKMGSFILVVALVYVGVLIATAFMIIPGIILQIAWMLALYLAVDKDMNPMEAIYKSNQMTYGRKGTIFLSMLVLGLVILVGGGIAALIMRGSPFIRGIIYIAVTLLYIPLNIGATSYIYGILSEGTSAPIE